MHSPGFLHQESCLLVCFWHSLIKLTSALCLLLGLWFQITAPPQPPLPRALSSYAKLHLISFPIITGGGHLRRDSTAGRGPASTPKQETPPVQLLRDMCEPPYLSRLLTPLGIAANDPLNPEQKMSSLKHPTPRQLLPSGSEISDSG